MNFLKLWTPVIGWCVLIFYFSSIPGLNSGLDLDYVLRKLAHMMEYFILMLLVYRALKNSVVLRLWILLVYSALLSLGYAMSDEFHQTFVVGRQGAWTDVVIDGVGILWAGIMINIFRNMSKR